jgi:SAM-dependent methyltransferase
MRYGWNHPETARAYEVFCVRHRRYHTANQALIDAAALRPGQRILDLASGTGRTAAIAHDALEGHCELVCIEPADAMRAVGEQRLPHARWVAEWPPDETFDRVLCGAALWQFSPLDRVVTRAFSAVRRGGAFAFTIPLQYLGQPDDPGGGADAWLTNMVGYLADGLVAQAGEADVHTEAEVEGVLTAAGFRPVAWSVRGKLTQEEYRDWLKIPVLTDALLGAWDAVERAARIDAAFARSDAASWRWEAWRGWTAWK